MFLEANNALFRKKTRHSLILTGLTGQKLPTLFAQNLIISLLYVKPVTSTMITF